MYCLPPWRVRNTPPCLSPPRIAFRPTIPRSPPRPALLRPSPCCTARCPCRAIPACDGLGHDKPPGRRRPGHPATPPEAVHRGATREGGAARAHPPTHREKIQGGGGGRLEAGGGPDCGVRFFPATFVFMVSLPPPLTPPSILDGPLSCT